MTQGQSEAERVRSYLVTQANKLTLADLVAKVRADTAPLKEAASLIPPELLSRRPGENDWSAAEVWTHILQVNEQGATAIEGILANGRPPEQLRDVISGETRPQFTSGEQYYAAYHQRREQLLTRVLKARGDEYLDVKIHHQLFGDLSWREWLLFMRVHDLDHLRQLQAIARALGC